MSELNGVTFRFRRTWPKYIMGLGVVERNLAGVTWAGLLVTAGAVYRVGSERWALIVVGGGTMYEARLSDAVQP